ncbi:MAG TPA: hypothetical protein VGM87_23895 [Roseomonas sp.]
MPKAEERTSFEASIEQSHPGRWGASFLIRGQQRPGVEKAPQGLRIFASEAAAESWIWNVATALGYGSIMLSRPSRLQP